MAYDLAMVPLKELYRTMGANYHTLKAQSASLIERWEFTGGRRHHPVPFYFEKNGFARGKISKDPAKATFSYGFDVKGRVIVERAFAGSQHAFDEEIFVCLPEAVESVRFDPNKQVISVSRQTFENGSLAAYEEYTQVFHTAYSERFFWHGGRLVRSEYSPLRDAPLIFTYDYDEEAAAQCVLDLACGTGRVGAWLRKRSAAAIDGVDVTPEMIAVARKKGVYRTLRVSDVVSTGFEGETYDLCIQALADEHLPELPPLYAEVARVTKAGGTFAIVGFHPQFLMAGMPTHYDRAPGEAVTIRSYVHLLSDHVKTAQAAGWSLLEMDEGLIDNAWLQKKPKWAGHFGLPISFAMVWQRA